MHDGDWTPADEQTRGDALSSDVRRAYLLFLGREPESAEAVAGKLGLPLADLVESVVDCEEFRIGMAAALASGKVVPEPAPFTAEDLDWARRRLPVSPSALSPTPAEPDWNWLRIACLSDPEFAPARPGSAVGDLADRLRVIHSEAFHTLFDPDWYARRHPDVGDAEGALEHYLTVGGRDRRNPHPLFLTSWYLRQGAKWDAADDLTPLEHYLNKGGALGLSPHFAFDAKHYRARGGAFTGDALSHYLRVGHAEGRDPHPYFRSRWYEAEHMADAPAGQSPLRHFAEAWAPLPDETAAPREGPRPSPHPLLDLEAYLHDNPDVAASQLPPFVHYILHGEPEGRKPHRVFDAKLVQRCRKDDENAQKRPLGFYLEHGDEAGLDPNPYFDNGWYAEHNTLGDMSALEHYLLKGSLEGAAINSVWDEELYYSSNPDVHRQHVLGRVRAGGLHFMQCGAFEIIHACDNAGRRFSFRQGGSVFDLVEADYLEDNTDVGVLIARGKYGSGLEHFIRAGYAEMRDGLRAVYAASRFARLVRTMDGASPRQGAHACIFAHYDQDGMVDDYVVTYLAALKDLGFDIFFITATTEPEALARAAEHCVEILIKNDAGRDFHAWRLACDHYGVDAFEQYEHFVLANDSVYFPVNDPSHLMSFEAIGGFDFWGVTDSRDSSAGQYHIQSYFLGFSRKARREALPRMLERLRERPILSKRGQIVDFEIGFTQIALDHALSVGALCAIDDIREDMIRDPRLFRWRPILQFGLEGVNPTMRIWEPLLTYYGCPSLKVQLLRDNPTHEADVERWAEVIDTSWVSEKAIRAHQSRLRGERSPGVGPLRGRGISVASPGAAVGVREHIEGRGYGAGKHLLLLAHYDPDDILDDHVVASIRGLRRADCDVVVVTSTDRPSEVRKMRDEAAGVVLKTPGGRDFGSWYAAGEVLGDKFKTYESVIWMNDSTYYPLFDSREMFDAMEARKLDFWGVVDSHNLRWHVMSWFWSFGRRIVSEGIFDWYRQEYNSSYTKWSQIKNYEMRVPTMLKNQGFSTGAFVEAFDVAKVLDEDYRDHDRYSGRYDFTMTHDFWDVIIERFRCPALKVELLRDNPLGVDLSSLFDLVRDHTDYDPQLIKAHMRRIKTGHLPVMEERAARPALTAAHAS